MAKYAFKLSTILGEKFGIDLSEMAKNALKVSTMVGENFGIYPSQVAKTKNALKFKLSTINHIPDFSGKFPISRTYPGIIPDQFISLTSPQCAQGWKKTILGVFKRC